MRKTLTLVSILLTFLVSSIVGHGALAADVQLAIAAPPSPDVVQPQAAVGPTLYAAALDNETILLDVRMASNALTLAAVTERGAGRKTKPPEDKQFTGSESWGYHLLL